MVKSLLPAVISGVFSVLTVWWVAHTNRQTKAEQRGRDADAEHQRLEAQAYERARESYESALQTATSQIRQFEKRIEVCERRAILAEERASQLTVDVMRGREKVSELTLVVAALRHELTKHGIEIPQHLMNGATDA